MLYAGRVRPSSRDRLLVVCGLLLSFAVGAPAAAVRPKKKAHAPTGPRRVAVLELSSLGVPEALRRNLEALLDNSMRTIKDVQLIPPLDLRIMLQAPKYADLAQCGGGPDCALRTARVAGAQVVVFGTVAAIGDSFNLNLRAMNVADGKEIGRQKADVAGSRDLLIPQIRLAAYNLIAPDQIRGSLLVDISIAGVAVSVDGHEAGVTPLPKAIDGLTPGDHHVVLKRPGYATFEQNLSIKAFETARLHVDLGGDVAAAKPALPPPAP